MADVAVDYASVSQVSTQLNSAVTTTVPQLTSLLNAVTALLQSDGGLWLQKSSPVLTKQYTDFNTSVTSAVNNINSFATQFNTVVQQLQTMDSSIAGNG